MKKKILFLLQIAALTGCASNLTLDEVLKKSEIEHEERSGGYWSDGHIQKEIKFRTLPKGIKSDSVYMMGFKNRKIKYHQEKIFAALKASQIGVDKEKKCLVFFTEETLASKTTVGGGGGWTVTPFSIYKDAPMEVNRDRMVRGRPDLSHSMIYVAYPTDCSDSSDEPPYFHIEDLLDELDKKEGALYLHFNKKYSTKSSLKHLKNAGNDILDGNPLRSLLTIGKIEFTINKSNLVVNSIKSNYESFPTDLKVGDKVLSCAIFNKAKTIRSVEDIRTCTSLYTIKDLDPSDPLSSLPEIYYVNVIDKNMNARIAHILDE